jgi:hypothetical protein
MIVAQQRKISAEETQPVMASCDLMSLTTREIEEGRISLPHG